MSDFLSFSFLSFLFLVRHFLLFKGNKAFSYIQQLLLDFFSGIGAFRKNARLSAAPNDNFRKIICSGDDLRSRIFESFSVKFLACLPLLGFSNIKKMV